MSVTTSEYNKLVAMIFGDDQKIGSGCFVWSDDKSTLYCITAKHCTQTEDGEDINIKIKIDVNSHLTVVEFYDEKIISDTEDIAIFKVKQTEYTKNIPFIETSDFIRKDNNITLSGYLNISEFEHRVIASNYLTETETEISINVPELENDNYFRHDGIVGISGGGCYEVIDNIIRFIGIEYSAVDESVSLKELKIIKVSCINNLLRVNDLPVLPKPTPSYISKKLGEYTTIDESLRIISFENEWVDLKISEIVKENIESHVSSDDLSLYICGFSGIGKTRSVLNACKEMKDHFIYYESFKNFESTMVKLRDDTMRYKEKINIIIDEVTLDNFNSINTEFENDKSLFKFILIGTVSHSQSNLYNNIIYLSQIEKNDVVNVISRQYPEFSKEETEEIYNLSYNDLRLAILIARLHAASKSDHNSQFSIDSHSSKMLFDNYSSAEKILRRTFELNKRPILDEKNIKEYFERLSLFIDIGYKGINESEIKNLASYFDEKNYSNFMLAIDYLKDINLGIDKGNFFEASPRALAKLAFEEGGWSRIKYDFDGFMNSIEIDLLKKRFYDRVSECSINEVKEALATYFQRKYSYNILTEIDSSNAKEIMLFIEHSPEIGLIWLKKLVFNTNDEAIAKMRGTQGRRNIVWTCERLANFKEWFYVCEEILYKLAQNESEHSISNNSQGVWSGLYSLSFSNTEVSFYDRIDLLINRALNSVSNNDAKIFQKAFSNALYFGSGVTTVPPKMIGGIITPPSWQVNDFRELVDIKIKILDTIYDNSENFNEGIKEGILEAIRINLGELIGLGLIERLKLIVRRLSTNQNEKNKFIVDLKIQSKCFKQEDLIDEINVWIEELNDDSLLGRLNSLSVNSGYLMYEDTFDLTLSNLAKDLLADEDCINILEQVVYKKELDNDCMFRLAEMIAEFDNDFKCIVLIKKLFETNLNENFVKGYFCGVSKIHNKLPEQFITLLDEFEHNSFDLVFWASIIFDISEKGYKRIINLISKTTSIIPIQKISCNEWAVFLSTEKKIEILSLLLQSDSLAKYNLYFEIVYRWIQQNCIFDEIYENSLDVLKECISEKTNLNFYVIINMFNMFKMFPDKYNDKIIELFTMIFDFNDIYSMTNDDVVEIICNIKDENNEKRIMHCFGERLIDSAKSLKGPATRGFFEMFSLSTVVDWVEVDKENRATLIAYHLKSPTLKSPEISAFTKGFLQIYNSQEVINQFYIGGYNLKAYKLKDYYDNKENWNEILSKYEQSDINAISKWATFERECINNICKQYVDLTIETSRYE